MELSEYISKSLKEILRGINEAQNSDGGENINAKKNTIWNTDQLFDAGEYGMFTRVDFDIAVSAETEGAGSGGLRVFGLGVDASAEHRRGAANRLTFSVPVRLPFGDVEKAQKIDEHRNDEYLKAKERWRGRPSFR
ncbi:hypothetical protein [Martelella sp. AD-3]|uniref:hypothetical protein n=1 Tax=Martelella sp. AD-3 TaxID=686597 RepID=UPI00126956E7|nr:hypothetical protein [Martelella sp. AD-3]